MPPLTLAPLSLASSASSSVIFNGNSGTAVTLGPTFGSPLTVPPDPAPTPTPTATSTDPEPTPTVTVTQTVAPPGPSEVSGTVKLDDGQFLGLTIGLVLILVFLPALLVAQMRRP